MATVLSQLSAFAREGKVTNRNIFKTYFNTQFITIINKLTFK